MTPKNLAFGGGAGETMLHPLMALWMLIAVVLIFTTPRNKAIAPFLIAFFTTPVTQVVLIGPLHFPILRILILTGLVRMARDGKTSGGKFPGGFNGIDRVVVSWAVSALVVVSLQWMDPQGLIKFVGDFLDSLGGYLVVRYFITDREAIKRAIKALGVVCLIQGLCMVSEQFTHQNVFGIFGENAPTFRNGKIRSEGGMGTLFGGTFAGVQIPLFIWLWSEKEYRLGAATGLLGATMMVWASHASTSWLGYASGLLGLSFWVLRKQMRILRWALVATLVALHLAMKGPVWSLIAKIDLTGGSSSYHRYYLVDNCIRHFSDWWFLGYRYYGIWGYDMWDLCNQFVVAALTGGLITLVFFVLIYSRGFGLVGKRVNQKKVGRKQAWLLWCLGATLFANVVASFGINYMIQLQVMLFVLISCISVGALEIEKTVVRDAKPKSEFLLVSTQRSAPIPLSVR